MRGLGLREWVRVERVVEGGGGGRRGWAIPAGQMEVSG